jgi:hypothetical protein
MGSTRHYCQKKKKRKENRKEKENRRQNLLCFGYSIHISMSTQNNIGEPHLLPPFAPI